MNAAETKRPKRVTREAPPERDASVDRLTQLELEEELTIAAMAAGRLRWERYATLLAERARRAA
jgi:hypothetical protein